MPHGQRAGRRTGQALRLTALLFAYAAAGSATTGGAVLFVDADAGAGGDGTSWATAFDTLQDALAVATSGDEIRLAQGIYYPDDGMTPPAEPRDATFQLVSGVQVLGGYAGFGEPNPDLRRPATLRTVLSGDLGQNDLFDGASVLTTHSGIVPDATGALGVWQHMDDNAFHVVTSSGTTGAVLDGFVITAGHADGSGAARDGGGLYSSAGAATLVDLVFQGNFADFRGGALADQNGSDLVLERVDFVRNAAQSNGGAFFHEGGTATLNRALFLANVSGAIGGAIYLREGGDAELFGVRFLSNSAGTRAGALDNQNSAALLVNSLFSGNTAAGTGGALYTASTEPFVLTNSAFFSNSSLNSIGGAIAVGFQSPAAEVLIQNSVFWENSASAGAEITIGLPGVTLSHNLVDATEVGGIAWTDGGGNITGADIDPLFLDPDGPDGLTGTLDDDLHLGLGSPAIDVGDDGADLDGSGSGTDTVANLPTDLDGFTRIVDGNGDSTAAVDLGPFEFDPTRIFVDGFETSGLSRWSSAGPEP